MCNLFVLCPVLQQGDYELNLTDIFSLKGPWPDMSGNRPFLHSCKKKAPTWGSDGRNTVICMKMSVWALSLFLYVCSLERNVGKVSSRVKPVNTQFLTGQSSLTSCYFKSCLSCEITNNSWLLPLLCILLVISILGHCVALWNNIIILIHK